MKKQFLSVFLLAGIIASVGVTAGANAPDQIADEAASPGIQMVSLLVKLNLQEDQKNQIARIIKGSSGLIREDVDSLIAARKNLFNAIHNEEFDEQAVRSASQSVAQEEESLAVERAKAASKIQAVLNAEQKHHLLEAKEKFGVRLEKNLTLLRSLVDRWVESRG